MLYLLMDSLIFCCKHFNEIIFIYLFFNGQTFTINAVANLLCFQFPAGSTSSNLCGSVWVWAEGICWPPCALIGSRLGEPSLLPERFQVIGDVQCHDAKSKSFVTKTGCLARHEWLSLQYLFLFR